MPIFHINFELDAGAQVPAHLRHLLISSPYKLDSQPHPIDGQPRQIAYYTTCRDVFDAIAFAKGLGEVGQDAISVYDGATGAFILRTGKVAATWNGYDWTRREFKSPFQNLD